MAIFTVTTGADINDANDGVLSLREAVDAAVDSDTIVFDGALTTVALTSAITLFRDITIDGDRNNDGLADVTVSGGGVTHHFHVLSPADVVIDGLKLTDGAGESVSLWGFSTVSAVAAGSIVNEGRLTVTNTVFAANGAVGLDGFDNTYRGNDGASGDIFSRNGRDGGDGGSGGEGGHAAGAIANVGTLHVVNVDFAGNSATGGSGGDGGDGGNGGNGAEGAIFTHRVDGGTGGSGGSGGRGGQGGSASSAVLNLGTLQADGTLAANSGATTAGQGGTTGNGGNGGHGGDGCDGFNVSGTDGGRGGAGGSGRTPGAGGSGGAGGTASGYGYPGSNGANGANGFQMLDGNAGSAGTFLSESFFFGYLDEDYFVQSAASIVYLATPEASVSEDGGRTITFYVNRAGDLSAEQSVTVALAFLGLTAEDFAGGTLPDATRTVTIAAGAAQASLTVTFADDNITEKLGRVTATITDGGGAALGGTASVGFDITDDDVATAGDDVLAGEDTGLTVNLLGGNDEFTAGSGDDVIYGAAGNDHLKGGAGSDRLNGGTGADRLVGGEGDDTYVVNSARDRVEELADGGWDAVLSSVVDASLAVNAEELRLLQGAVTGTGNQGDNLIVGNADDNFLFGLGGIDRLYGGQGSDQLDGGAGDDRMAGGDGDDTYFAGSSGDVAYEWAGQGTDTVEAAADYRLGANVENLIAVGSGGRALTGNGLGNTITGGEGADRIWGLAVNDRIDGGAGSDQLSGGVGRDTFIATGAAGSDRILDFEAGPGSGDWLRVSGGQFADAGAVLAALRQDGADVVLGIDADSEVVFANRTVNQFAVDDFLVV